MKKTMKNLTLGALALCSGILIGTGYTTLEIASADTIASFTVESVALRVPDDNYGKGLRFKVAMSKDDYTANNVASCTTGVLLTPKTLLGSAELTAGMQNDNVIEKTGITWREEDGKMVTYVHVYDITEEYYASQIALRAYVDDTSDSDTPAYTDTVVCSVAYAADWAYNNDTTLDDTAKATLQQTYLTYDVIYHNGDATTETTGIYNNKISAPEAPEKTGYVFDGWYNKAETAKWDFDVNVIGGVTTNLYAKWTLDADYVIDKINALPTTNVQTTAITAQVSEIETLCKDADTSAVTNYSDFVAYVDNYKTLPSTIALDVSNATDLAYVSAMSDRGDTQKNTYTVMHSGTISVVDDDTHGKVIELQGVDHSNSFVRVNIFAGLTAEESQSLWENKLTGIDKVVFYIYNPTSNVIPFRFMRSEWGMVTAKVDLQANAWTQVAVNKADFLRATKIDTWDDNGTAKSAGFYFFFQGSMPSALDGVKFKISSFYGYTKAGYEAALQASVAQIIDLINALPTTNVQTATITAQIAEIETMYGNLPASSQESVTNYAKFVTYKENYAALPLARTDLATLQAKTNATLGSTFVAATEITAPDGADGSVIKTTIDATSGFPTLPFIYANAAAQKDYPWAKNPILSNVNNTDYYHAYVSVWVKVDAETTLSFFTMNSGWARRRENYTIRPEDGWVLLIVQLNKGQVAESTGTGYGYLAGIQTVDANNTKVNGEFYMCDLKIWSSDPTAILAPKQ